MPVPAHAYGLGNFDGMSSGDAGERNGDLFVGLRDALGDVTDATSQTLTA